MTRLLRQELDDEAVFTDMFPKDESGHDRFAVRRAFASDMFDAFFSSIWAQSFVDVCCHCHCCMCL